MYLIECTNYDLGIRTFISTVKFQRSESLTYNVHITLNEQFRNVVI